MRMNLTSPLHQSAKPSIIVQRQLPVRFAFGPTEPSADNAFNNEVVGGARCAPSYPEVYFPRWRDIQVNAGEELLLLISEWVETGDWSHSSIVFKSSAHHLREVIRNFYIRRKLKAAADIWSMQSLVECGIEREIPPSDFLIQDGPHLPGPGIFREFCSLIPDFVGQADANRPVPFFRNTKPGSNMVAYPVPTVAGTGAGEDVE